MSNHTKNLAKAHSDQMHMHDTRASHDHVLVHPIIYLAL